MWPAAVWRWRSDGRPLFSECISDRFTCLPHLPSVKLLPRYWWASLLLFLTQFFSVLFTSFVLLFANFNLRSYLGLIWKWLWNLSWCAYYCNWMHSMGSVFAFVFTKQGTNDWFLMLFWKWLIFIWIKLCLFSAPCLCVGERTRVCVGMCVCEIQNQFLLSPQHDTHSNSFLTGKITIEVNHPFKFAHKYIHRMTILDEKKYIINENKKSILTVCLKHWKKKSQSLKTFKKLLD